MSNEEHLRLYIHKINSFLGAECSYRDADYVILGVPFDRTYTYRPGQRLAPQRIREASQNLETFHFETEIDIEDLNIADLGDLDVSHNMVTTLNRLTKISENILADKKIPIILGGEHTLTLAILNAYPQKPAVLYFDAHLDLRKEYQDERISHATFMRRYIEERGADNVIYLGVRAVSKEEIEYAKTIKLFIQTATDVQEKDPQKIIRKINNMLKDQSDKHLTIDMDVFDPSYAPSVGNPEPFGITPLQFKKLITKIADSDIKTIDIVETAPHNDSDQTTILAAKIVLEILALLENARNR